MKKVITIIGCWFMVSALLVCASATAETTVNKATQPAPRAYALDGASMAVGYQGIMSFELPGKDETLNGVSFRLWKQPLGLNLSLSHLSRDTGAGASDESAFLLDIRGLYSLIKKQHSRLYAGLELGLGSAEFGGDSESLIIFGPLVGFEFSFSELPELSFHWDAAYTITDAGDYDENGIKVTLGIHYQIN